MERRGFLARHGIVRSAIRADLLQFGLPAIGVLFMGLVVSSRDGYDGLTRAVWELLRNPRNLAETPWYQIVGLAIFLGGLGFAIAAVLTLKRFYAATLVTREDHQLIRHGVYRFVRHPIYLAVLVILVIGVPLYSASFYGFLTLSLEIPLFLNRIRMEERLLTEQLGDEYRAYQQETRKLIPFVY